MWELFIEMKISRNSFTNPRANTKLIYVAAAAANKQTRFPLNRMSIIITQFPPNFKPNYCVTIHTKNARFFSQTMNQFNAINISYFTNIHASTTYTIKNIEKKTHKIEPKQWMSTSDSLSNKSHRQLMKIAGENAD